MFNSERHMTDEQRRALDAIDQEAAERSLAEVEDEHRRRFRHGLNRDDLATNGTGTAGMIARQRRRIIRPVERLQSARDRLERLARRDSTEPTPPPLTSRLSHLTSSIQPSQTRPSDHEPDTNRHRAKRRKLDDGTSDDDGNEPVYSDEGRLFPGPLQMQIVSCDGGEFTETGTEIDTSPSYVLRDDEKVYSTQESKCNILLKHKGGVPFTLTKLLIRAPPDYTRYSAPVRQGMVFVSMDDENLVDRSKYYDRFCPHTHRYHRLPRHDTDRPSSAYIHPSRALLRSRPSPRFPIHEDDLWLLDIMAEESELASHIPAIPGFNVTFDSVPDLQRLGEDTEHSFALSPRPYHRDHPDYDSTTDYPTRSYFVDRYRPNYDRYSRHSNFSRRRDNEQYRSPYLRPSDINAASAAAAAASNVVTASNDDSDERNSSDSESEDFNRDSEAEPQPNHDQSSTRRTTFPAPSEEELGEAIDRQRQLLINMRRGHDRVAQAVDELELNGTSYRRLPSSATANPNLITSEPRRAEFSNKRLPGQGDGASTEGDDQESKVKQEVEKEAGGLVPHARFTVNTDRSSAVEIKFEPAV